MTKLHLFSSLTLSFALTLSTGCPADDSAGDTAAEGTTGGADDGGTNMTTVGGSGMMDGDSTGGMTDSGGPMTMGMTTTAEGGSSEGGVDPLPDGSQCTEDADCISMECYVAGGLGGICGECNEDADCDFGCSLPNPLTSAPSTCNDGTLGAGCESSDICVDDLICALILDVPTVLSASTCSECEDDAGCEDGDSCQPSYDVQNISGSKTCVTDLSLPDGSGCDLTTGSGACTSTFCAEATAFEILTLGVCSGCLTDDDCMGDDVCIPPEIDLAQGLIAGACGAAE